jgi:hypothetical protein
VSDSFLRCPFPTSSPAAPSFCKDETSLFKSSNAFISSALGFDEHPIRAIELKKRRATPEMVTILARLRIVPLLDLGNRYRKITAMLASKW